MNSRPDAVDSEIRSLTWGVDFRAEDLPAGDVDFLRALGGPCFIAVPGVDRSQTRVVTTLLHGNEPSGVRAMLRWLQQGPEPAADTLLLVASVDTALEEPIFSHRQLADRRDFNRCFERDPTRPAADREARLAQKVLATILAANPAHLVDLHNNTGHNPAYGVVVSLGEAELGLVSLFADRVVHAPLALGTLVEATIDHCPSVTIECGRSGDPVADDAAYRGLVAFLERPDLRAPNAALAVLVDPIRVCVAPGIALAFGDQANPDVPLTISADIDRHNFTHLPAGTPIGWVRAGTKWPVVATGPDGRECGREIFRVRAGVLETRRAFTPIMMTVLPEIAISDCLFYVVRSA